MGSVSRAIPIAIHVGGRFGWACDVQFGIHEHRAFGDTKEAAELAAQDWLHWKAKKFVEERETTCLA